MIYDVVETHVSDIKHGDTIIENGELVTISRSYIKRDPLIGTTIRGNSYHGGRKSVLKAVIKRNVNGVMVDA